MHLVGFGRAEVIEGVKMTLSDLNILEQRARAAQFRCEGVDIRARDPVDGSPFCNEYLELRARATQLQRKLSATRPGQGQLELTQPALSIYDDKRPKRV